METVSGHMIYSFWLLIGYKVCKQIKNKKYHSVRQVLK